MEKTIIKGKKFISALKDRFKVEVIRHQPEDQITILVDRNDLPEVVRTLYYDMGGWLSTMISNDEREMNGNYALYYVLSMEGNKMEEGDELPQEEKCWITVKALIPAHDPTYPSVSLKVPAAVWYEREARDMMGLVAEGLPDQRRLVLSDDFPAGIYPLRKDSIDYRERFQPCDVDKEPDYDFLYPEGTGTMDIPLGPTHITSDEPGHFRLFVDGETIIDADYKLFYVHRGVEKLAENRMDYDQMAFLAERICGICGFAHAVACIESSENVSGVDVPLRAQAIRTMCLETERLHSHLLNIGLASEFTGNVTAFLQLFKIREHTMEMAQILTGGRKTYGMILTGGVRRDITDVERKEMHRIMDKVEIDFKECLEGIVDSPNFLKRVSGVGVLNRKIARDFSPVGPNVRGAGFKRDARYDHPFDWYKNVEFKVPVHTGCDVLSRVLVRAEEFYETLSIIRQCLETMPHGPVMAKKAFVDPYSFGLGFVEAPRGEDVHWTMHGNAQKVHRWRIRASTYNNWPSLRFQFRGNSVADAPLIVGSLDPCYSCSERVTIVDVKKQKTKIIKMDDLKKYAITQKDSPLKNS
jgi:formate hydrogenlyase subunit 5